MFTNSISIVAVDSDLDYLESIKPIFKPFPEYKLSACFHRFSEDGNIVYFLEKIGTLQPDIILMEYSFEGANRRRDFGLTLVRKVLQQRPEQKIIMLVNDENDSPRNRWKKVHTSLAAGAKGYLRKRNIGAWRDATSEVFSGDKFVDQDTLKTILNSLGSKVDRSYKLSDRQVEVLAHLAADKTIKEVAKDIVGRKGIPISVHAINFHLRNIRGRLNCHTLHGIVAKALRKKIIH